MKTQFVSENCKQCSKSMITLDEHYQLTPCHDFILVCPNHPSNVVFDLTEEAIIEIANQ